MDLTAEQRFEKAVQHAISYAHFVADRDCKGHATTADVLNTAAARAGGQTPTSERDMAIWMLAEWCVDVDLNGTGWDDWDDNYKDAMYRAGPLRGLLDAAIEQVRKQRQPDAA